MVNAYSIPNSGSVTIDNSSMGLTKNGQAVTNVQDAIEAIYTTASTVGCPTGYEMVSVGNYYLSCRSTSAPICKRATTLHTETCESGVRPTIDVLYSNIQY